MPRRGLRVDNVARRGRQRYRRGRRRRRQIVERGAVVGNEGTVSADRGASRRAESVVLGTLGRGERRGVRRGDAVRVGGRRRRGVRVGRGREGGQGAGGVKAPRSRQLRRAHIGGYGSRYVRLRFRRRFSSDVIRRFRSWRRPRRGSPCWDVNRRVRAQAQARGDPVEGFVQGYPQETREEPAKVGAQDGRPVRKRGVHPGQRARP